MKLNKSFLKLRQVFVIQYKENGLKSILGWAVLIVGVVVILASCEYYFDHTVVKERRIDYGTIQKVENCKREGKSTHRCTVTTQYGSSRLNINDWPEAYFYVGDRLWGIEYTFKRMGNRVAFCKNDLCYGLIK